MDVHVVHCSACDRPVRVLLPEGVDAWPPPDARAREAVCLAQGEECTGEMCPVLDVPAGRMRENLAGHRRARQRGEEA